MADDDGQVFIEQWASDVVDFTSQYGSESSISYTVTNITGKSNIYPTYGDFTQACVLRTYGHWWTRAPSAELPFKRPSSQSTCSHDYIDLRFAEKVFPKKIEIFETYNPGSVTCISVCQMAPPSSGSGQKTQWMALWSGECAERTTKSTIFSPPLRPCPFATNLVRLEFNQSRLEYYAELDAVRLSGTRDDGTPTGDTQDGRTEGRRASAASHDATPTSDVADGLAQLRLEHEPTETETMRSEGCYFSSLPGEVLQLILSFLDLASLCKMACTCHLFRRHSYDPSQYSELNLQPSWRQVQDSTMRSLQSRCRTVKRLRLAWCGNYGRITPPVLESYFLTCGSQLTCLDLACCHFVDNNCMRSITELCPLLQELNIQSNRTVDKLGFIHITKSRRLQRLNLYRTKIDIHSLICIVRSCPDLEHLNIGSCTDISSYDEVVLELTNACRNLKTLDVWRAKTFSSTSLHALATCPRLQELDVGWCSNLRSVNGCIENLVRNCRHLQKLFLTANRTVCDADLEAISAHCQFLQQLDILGMREISEEAVLSILENCKHLRFVDVSFCSGITMETVRQWRCQFPDISIKKSYQNLANT